MSLAGFLEEMLDEGRQGKRHPGLARIAGDIPVSGQSLLEIGLERPEAQTDLPLHAEPSRFFTLGPLHGSRRLRNLLACRECRSGRGRRRVFKRRDDLLAARLVTDDENFAAGDRIDRARKVVILPVTDRPVPHLHDFRPDLLAGSLYKNVLGRHTPHGRRNSKQQKEQFLHDCWIFYLLPGSDKAVGQKTKKCGAVRPSGQKAHASRKSQKPDLTAAYDVAPRTIEISPISIPDKSETLSPKTVLPDSRQNKDMKKNSASKQAAKILRSHAGAPQPRPCSKQVFTTYSRLNINGLRRGTPSAQQNLLNLLKSTCGF